MELYFYRKETLNDRLYREFSGIRLSLSQAKGVVIVGFPSALTSAQETKLNDILTEFGLKRDTDIAEIDKSNIETIIGTQYGVQGKMNL